MLKLIGLMMVVTASSLTGLGMARTVRCQQLQTSSLLDCIVYIKQELRYRMTPLPDVFDALGSSAGAQVGAFFAQMAQTLQTDGGSTVGFACRMALAQTRGLQLPSPVCRSLQALFDQLGRFDLEGNVQALELAQARLQAELDALRTGGRARCWTYLTLGVCTGLAAAVILI